MHARTGSFLSKVAVVIILLPVFIEFFSGAPANKPVCACQPMHRALAGEGDYEQFGLLLAA